jgi:hypothetical protein
MTEIIDSTKSPYSDKYPCRLPVWWGRYGEIGPHPEGTGISGRKIVIRIEKKFKKIESIFAKILRAPKELRRPLDKMNSLLWELCDGTRTFQDICEQLDSTYHEEIAPVVNRTTLGIGSLISNNLMLALDEPLNGKWNIGPGVTPAGQNLDDLDERLNIDISLLEGEVY